MALKVVFKDEDLLIKNTKKHIKNKNLGENK
jgi:hypothetical protein